MPDIKIRFQYRENRPNPSISGTLLIGSLKHDVIGLFCFSGKTETIENLLHSVYLLKNSGK